MILTRTDCRRVDKHCDEVERNPSPAVLAAWEVAQRTGEVMKDPAIQRVAQATVTFSTKVAKELVPLGMSVTSWALKTAVTLASSATDERGGTQKRTASTRKR